MPGTEVFVKVTTGRCFAGTRSQTDVVESDERVGGCTRAQVEREHDLVLVVGVDVHLSSRPLSEVVVRCNPYWRGHGLDLSAGHHIDVEGAGGRCVDLVPELEALGTE